MAKSEWRKLRAREGGRTVWIAYRLIDKERPDAEGNREYFGEYSPRRSTVERLVEVLNEQEAEA